MRARLFFKALKQLVFSKRVYRNSLNLQAALFMSILVRFSCILILSALSTFCLLFWQIYASTVRIEARWLVFIFKNSFKAVSTRYLRNFLAKETACT